MAAKSKHAWALKHYTDLGWEMTVVERVLVIPSKVPTEKPRVIIWDMYGFGDLYGFRGKPWSDHIIVQVTTDSNHDDRVKKILGEPRAENWLRASHKNRVEVISIKRDAKIRDPIRVQAITTKDFG